MSFKLVHKLRTKTGIKLGTKHVIYQKLNYVEKGYPCQQSWNWILKVLKFKNKKNGTFFVFFADGRKTLVTV